VAEGGWGDNQAGGNPEGALRPEACHTPKAGRNANAWPVHTSTGGSISMSMSQFNSSSQSKPTQWKSLIDRLSVTAFLVAWTVMILDIAPEIFTPDAWLTTLSGVCLGYLLPDLLAGSVHWIADRFFEPDTPVLGTMLITPFRDHHDDALGITRHDFYEVSGNNALVTIPVVLLVSALPTATGALHQFFLALGASTTLFLFMTNQFHSWAHSPSPPRPVRWLHATGIILTPKRHARHHRGRHDQAYCVTSGWLNPVLDRLKIFTRLERLQSRLPASTAKRNER
jgi:hypothetical protein